MGNGKIREPAWSGTTIIEFGTGAAGPIAVRYFAEHGARVIRIESRTRPDFLRTYGSNGPYGLEGSDMFDSLNVGKLGVTLNLKHPEGTAIARKLIGLAGRRRGELRAEGDARLRPRLRISFSGQAEPRHGELVPAGSDRPAPRLPGLRRPGLGARRLQHPDRLARPRAHRPVRHDHRLARAPLRRDRARSRPPLQPPTPARASTST